MITLQVLAPLARQEGVPLAAVERDYLQHLLLREIGRKPLVFKGGTCLRIVFRSPRYSEDLDFSSRGATAEILSILEGGARALLAYGIVAEWKRDDSEPHSVVGRIRFRGPLYTGDPRSEGTIRIEVSLRAERPLHTAERFVAVTAYPDVPQLVLTTLGDAEIFAEKLRALVIRSEPRDAFDLQFLMARGISASPALVRSKLGLYRRSLTGASLRAALQRAGGAWDRDLGPLLREVPPFPAVRQTIWASRSRWMPPTRRGRSPSKQRPQRGRH